MRRHETHESREARLIREKAEMELKLLRERGKTIERMEKEVEKRNGDPDFVTELIEAFRSRRSERADG